MSFVVGLLSAGVLGLAAFLATEGPINAQLRGGDDAFFVPLDSLKTEDVLAAATRSYEGKIIASETVVVDPQKKVLYALAEDGTIWTLPNMGKGEAKELSFVGGRPLGGALDVDGDLVIAEAQAGLIKVSTTDGSIKVLANRVDGETDYPRIAYADDVDVCADGMIYLSDAISHMFPSRGYDGHLHVFDTSVMNYLEGKATGRLLQYNPKTKKTKEIATGFHFANGVTCSHECTKDKCDYVLMNDTFRGKAYKINVKTGQKEVFAQGFPGYLDGISRGSKNTYWVAVPSVVDPTAQRTENYPALRNFIAKLPPQFRPQAKAIGIAIQLDKNGNILRVLTDRTAKNVHMITAVTELNDELYLGSLRLNFIAKYNLKN
eukprot:Clim_evm22s134 gene=Clim_evmTU22s134